MPRAYIRRIPVAPLATAYVMQYGKRHAAVRSSTVTSSTLVTDVRWVGPEEDLVLGAFILNLTSSPFRLFEVVTDIQLKQDGCQKGLR